MISQYQMSPNGRRWPFPPVNCEGCGELIAEPGNNQRFCTPECRMTALDTRRKILPTAMCDGCGQPFQPGTHNQRFCTPDCGKRSRDERSGRSPALVQHTSVTSGAISEMIVCTNLLMHGFEVFRAISPACSCDLVACKDEQRLRIEVRTGRRNLNGFVGCPVKASDRFDVLAIVVGKRDVMYFPPITNTVNEYPVTPAIKAGLAARGIPFAQMAVKASEG